MMRPSFLIRLIGFGLLSSVSSAEPFVASNTQATSIDVSNSAVRVVVQLDDSNKNDLVLLDPENNRLSILLHQSGGMFATPLTFALAGRPASIAAADIDGDSDQDLLVTYGDSATAEILWNDGSGNLSLSGSPFVISSSNVRIALASVNSSVDTFPDLILVDPDTQQLEIRLGNGAGSFGMAQISTLAVAAGPNPNPDKIATGDFNGDGFLDIATANTGEAYLSYLTGDGAGNFNVVKDAWVGAPQYDLRAVDVNNDGRDDLLAVVYGDGVNKVVVLKGQADSVTFPAAEEYSVASKPSHIAIADYNGDGFPDLLVGYLHYKSISLLLAVTSGIYDSPQDYQVPYTVSGLVFEDFDFDDFPDLIAIGSGGTVALHNNSREFVVIESSHPYGSNLDEYISYTFPEEVDAFEVYFSRYSKLGPGDTLQVDSADFSSPATYDETTDFASQTFGIAVTGNKIVFRLQSNSAGAGHGFSIIRVKRASDIDGDGISDVIDDDDDGDGLLDTEEDLNGNGIYEPELGETNQYLVDSDGDLFDDYYERNSLSTNPSSLDSDGDGLPDNIDINPNDPASVKFKFIQPGLTWLLSRQNSDGSWGEDGRQTLTTAFAVEFLRTQGFRGSAYKKGVAWLQNAEDYNNDYLARKIIALGRAGINVTPFVNQLLSERISRSVGGDFGSGPATINLDGWGTTVHYDFSLLDTGHVLNALFYHNYQMDDLPLVYNNLAFFQNSDGGWGHAYGRASDIASTSAILKAFLINIILFPDQPSVQNYDAKVINGIFWLLGVQNGASNIRGFGLGGTSTIQDTSDALEVLNLALAAHAKRVGVGQALLSGAQWSQIANSSVYALNYLGSRLLTNGSWGNDVFLTSRALLSLSQFDMKDSNGSCLFGLDSDGDGIYDKCDDDMDGDGIPNENDAFPLDANESSDFDSDGQADGIDRDDDNDGVADNVDPFAFDATEWSDLDGDGIGDNADLDDDGDGINDEMEDLNKNGFVDVGESSFLLVDTDSDSVNDNLDNCPTYSNVDQEDLDQDSLGDVCDDDKDGDGFTVAAGDFNDWEASAYPGAAEICSDGIDQDGDSIDISCANGDINNDGLVNAIDILLLQKHLLGSIQLTADEVTKGDLYPSEIGDGELTVSDLLLLQRRVMSASE